MNCLDYLQSAKGVSQIGLVRIDVVFFSVSRVGEISFPDLRLDTSATKRAGEDVRTHKFAGIHAESR